MNLENYSVAVRLSLVENVSKGLLAMGAKFSTLNAQAATFQSKLSALRSQIAVGAGLLGGATAIAAPFIYGVSQASKLQQQLLFVQEKTAANTDEMNKFRGSIEGVANATGFASVQIANASKTLATGLNVNIAQLQNIIPLFSEFAAVQLRLKGTPISKSITQALQLVHLTGGHTDPESIKKELDLLSKVSLLMPGDIQKVLSAQKYAQGTLGNLFGVSAEQSMLLFASMQRMGIEGTRAGSQLLAAISRSMGKGILWAGLLPGQSGFNLENMGLTKGNVPQFFTNGKFDTAKWLGIINSFIKKEHALYPNDVATGKIATALYQTLGTTGTRIASAVSTDEGRKQMEEIVKSFEKMPELTEQFKQLGTLLSLQVTRGLKNVTSLFAELGYSLLPDATDIMGAFADTVYNLTLYVHNNQQAVARLEKAILSIAAAMAIGGLFLMMKAAFVGLFIPVTVLTGALTTLFPALAGAFFGINAAGVLVVAGIAAVSLSIYELYQNFDKVSDYFNSMPFFHLIERAFYYLGDVAYHLIHPLQTIANIFKSIIGYLSSPTGVGGKPDILGFHLGKPFANTTTGQPLGGADFLGFHFGKSVAPQGQTHHVVVSHARHNANLPNAGNGGMPNAGEHNTAKNQPIHVHVNLDGRKVASAVVDHVYKQSTQVPSTGSVFDSRLSPVPTILNNMGY